MSTVPFQDCFVAAVSRKKKRKGATRAPRRASFSVRLQDALADIVDTEWIKDCQKKLQMSLEKLGWTSPAILCLGLGSPTESANSVAQLALVISISDALKISRDRVSFFDPHFSQEDINGLLEMKCCVLTENKRGKHVLECRTLLVMPHCGIELYENILRENWGLVELQQLILLGNVLEDYATATPASKLEREAPCLSRIWNHLACDPISSLEQFPCAFNNLGIQYVRVDSLPQQGDALWTLPLPILDKTPSAEIT